MSVLLDAVRGQDVALETLRRARERGRLHHAYLFEGPDGVGKETTALGLAQLLVCERANPLAPAGAGLFGAAEPPPSPGPSACGACSACQRALPSPDLGRPVHPDVVVLARGLYEPAAIGRRTPENTELSIDQVRTLVLARAAFGPHEGRARVIVVRRAEELSVPAANALLKTLEEPGDRTHFVLLTDRPDALLPTIRSRVLRVRFRPLPEPLVAELVASKGVAADVAAEAARLAAGSVTRALALADADEVEARRAFAARVDAAVAARDLGPALELAEQAKKEKAGLAPRLEAYADELAALARRAASPRDARPHVTRHEAVLEALARLDRNAAAPLTIEAMLIRMRAAV